MGAGENSKIATEKKFQTFGEGGVYETMVVLLYVRESLFLSRKVSKTLLLLPAMMPEWSGLRCLGCLPGGPPRSEVCMPENGRPRWHSILISFDTPLALRGVSRERIFHLLENDEL